MWVYSVIMLIVAAVLIAVGAATYGGRTGLIHSYHQQRVTDKAGYGRAMGRAIVLMGVFFALSVVPLFVSRSRAADMWSVGLMSAGIVVSLVLIICAQIKYNKGIF